MRARYHERLSIRQGVIAAVLALCAGAGTLAGQSEVSRPIRIVIPDAMPLFDADVAERHPGAVVLRAVAFTHEPGSNGESLILLSPGHVNIETFGATLSLLVRSLEAGRSELIAVTEGMIRREASQFNRGAVARDFAKLNAATRTKLARVGYGRGIVIQRRLRMVEVDTR